MGYAVDGHLDVDRIADSLGVGGPTRQPEAAGLVRTNMFIGFALAEALALLGFVAPFVLSGR